MRWRRAALVLVAASTLLGTPAGPARPAAAQTAGALAGVQGRAGATGVAVAYRPEGLLPIASPVDLSSPDALATISSGPTTFARASVADPGDLLANPDALLALGSSDWEPGTIPPYPYRVSASSGTGAPEAESSPAPGLHARAAVEPTGSVAQATMPFLAAPAVATAGSIATEATTTTDGSTVTVWARSEVTDFDLLGILTIESVVSEVTASSDGTDTTVSGGTTITGASVLGEPVTIDATGVHGDAPSGPADPVLGDVVGSGGGSVDELLAGAGLAVTLVGPVAQDGETSGQLAAAGLRIELTTTDDTRAALGQLAALVPPTDAPAVEDLLALGQVRHVVRIDLARGFVSLTARARPAPRPLGSAGVSAAGTPSFGAGSLVGAAPLGRAPAAAPPGAPAASPAAPAQPAATTSLAGGIGALALLALLAQPFAGARLAALATALLAPGAAGSCAREER